MHCVLPCLPRHMGGGVRGGLITFLGLDMGRRNHQGRNFYFFSLLLELLIVHPQSCFEDLSHCIRPAFFGVVAAQPVSCTLKLGPIWQWVNTYRYIFSGMNIHLPAILMFTRGTRVLTHPHMSVLTSGIHPRCYCSMLLRQHQFRGQYVGTC